MPVTVPVAGRPVGWLLVLAPETAGARALWLLARGGMRRHSTYRLALLAGMTTNSAFGVIRASIVLAALASAGSRIGGYDAPTAMAFVWWGQALLGTINLWGFSEIRDRVRTGDVALDFLRPVDPQLAYLAADLGRAAVSLVARGLPTLAVGSLLFELARPPGLGAWLVGIVSVAIAVVVAFAGNFLVSLLAFWLVEIRGIQLVWMITTGLLCGLYLPVPWFPGWLRTMAQWSPFPSMLQNPIDILAGRVVGAAAWSSVGSQVFWAVVLLGVGRLVLRMGRRRLEVQGG